MPVVMGMMLLVQTVRHRQGPLRVEDDLGERPLPVQVAAARPAEEAPWIEGYGTVVPARTWHAVADVTGRVVQAHPDLKEGALVGKGEILLRIDESGYRLALRQQEAALAEARAGLQELRSAEKADGISLKTEMHAQALFEKDLKRYRNLLANGAARRSEVDALERALLAERQKVQALQKTLELLPSQQAALQARISGLEAAVDRASLDLEHCLILAPFEGRIAKLDVDMSQFVTAGREMFRIEDSSSLEINVQIGLDRLETLGLYGESGTHSRALVRLQGSTGKWFQWPARLDRNYRRVDPVTRTVGLVIRVDEALPEENPVPLLSGMYCQVLLMGEPVEGLLAIPREAIHGENVYFVTAENRLEPRKVQALESDGPDLLIRSGLSAGDRVVLSNLSTVIPGMKLAPVTEEAGSLADRREQEKREGNS